MVEFGRRFFWTVEHFAADFVIDGTLVLDELNFELDLLMSFLSKPYEKKQKHVVKWRYNNAVVIFERRKIL